jgi:hypothetical protein
MSWFKPKTHGYGAYPANWKGWAAIGVFFVVQMILLIVGIVVPLLSGPPPGVGRFVAWTVPSVLLTIVFLVVVRRKTDGDWRWRWGSRD